MVRTSSKTFSISKTPRETVRIPKGHAPSVGDYNPTRPFGAGARKMTFGGKYKTQSAAGGPSPCDYDPSIKLVKPRRPAAKMHQAQWVLLDEASLL